MEIEIDNPTKKVNWKQLEGEAGVTLKEIRTKGDKMFLNNLTQKQVNDIVLALSSHTAVFPKGISNQDIMNKLNTIGITP